MPSVFSMRSVLSWFVAALCGCALPLGAAEPATPLPLAKVVLFNSGVGYYEREGKVKGDATIDLRFNVADVNDLLKSLVPMDPTSKTAPTITYGSRDPITKTLKTFSIDLTSNPTLGQLLEQVRGEAVEVETSKSITGTILGVERRKRTVKDEVFEEEFLNLLTEDGLTSVALASVQRIKLSNPQLDAELREALAVLAKAHADDKKTVSVKFAGNDERSVSIGYVLDAPIWKTSYRLVLGKDESLLQGWAIVENATDEDWKDVSLSMVSGRPISFIMDLYQPLYMPRPTVEPELFASLRPQTYGQDMAAQAVEFAKKGESLKELDSLAMNRRREVAASAAPMAPGKPMAKSELQVGRGYSNADRNLDAAMADEKRSAIGIVPSAASADDVGELFEYKIVDKVTLPRQKSAMLPIVGGKVKVEKLSIYNPHVHAKHPLNGLRLTNSTDKYLMQGPITVFDDGAYAGDAQIENLAPGTDRLLSYAMDLDTEVATTSRQNGQRLMSVKIVRGVMQINNREERDHTYVVKNSGKAEKQVLVEQRLEPTWTLVAPEKPAEKTGTVYRFLVKAEVGKPVELKVHEEKTISSQTVLSNMSTDQVQIYIRSAAVSEATKKALEDLIVRQAKLAELRKPLQRVEQQVKIIEQEQARIRQNMNQLDRTSELYLRYVKKFTEQEDAMEKLRAEAKELEAKVDAETKVLNDYLATLSID